VLNAAAGAGRYRAGGGADWAGGAGEEA